MTTLLWFAELLCWADEATEYTHWFYGEIKSRMKDEHYKKWAEIGG